MLKPYLEAYKAPSNKAPLSLQTIKQVVWGFWGADHPDVLRDIGLSSRFPGARL